ncbi:MULTISPECIES: heavy metal-responsive transcriptional regulator [Leptospira]|jgi:DNA-binding transcriptional MerR regulator|uniref:heavy metal-responsive transcriptional regulator n=1 Tax=Leptospira TaxID=171 RepID=UPI0005623511|nr:MULTISPECIES: heavy metal-responsive transcriptional regulator [Leptospira]MCR1792530.1 heavy metal-responsive transcriptional regulator [Leptospira sp. id769339]
MKIGQIARKADVSVQTVRYYDSLGLLGKSARNEVGYRLYQQDVAARIRFIKRAQDLGFSLEEIGELLDLRIERPNQCASVKRKVEHKLELTRRKLEDLRKIERGLLTINRQCASAEPTGDCPLLTTLGGSNEKD